MRLAIILIVLATFSNVLAEMTDSRNKRFISGGMGFGMNMAWDFDTGKGECVKVNNEQMLSLMMNGEEQTLFSTQEQCEEVHPAKSWFSWLPWLPSFPKFTLQSNKRAWLPWFDYESNRKVTVG